MEIQQIRFINPVDFEETIVNVPTEKGERFLRTKIYTDEYSPETFIKLCEKYRVIGRDDIKACAEFEKSSGTQLLDNAIVQKSGDRYYFELSPKYSLVSNVKSEKHIDPSLFDENARYKMPVIVTKQAGGKIAISTQHSLMLSTKKELIEASAKAKKETAWECTVEAQVNGGYRVDINDVKCFMPGSFAMPYKLKDYSSLLGKKLNVVPISYSAQHDSIVVSHVDYLKILRSAELVQIAENLEAEPNRQYRGTVTKIGVNYILVTFLNASCAKIPTTDMGDGLTAMFANNELVVEETEIDFYIDTIIDTQTIMATQNFRSREIWNSIKESLNVGTKVTGTIQNVSGNLVFIWLDEYDVITAIARFDNHTYETGSQIDLIIKNVNADKRIIETSVASKRYDERFGRR